MSIVTDGGQPAAFCQEVVSTVAAAEFADSGGGLGSAIDLAVRALNVVAL